MDRSSWRLRSRSFRRYDAGQRESAQRKHGFTLIEILVVVAIIALLAAILIPSLQRARTQAKIAACKANTKQISYALTEYETENSQFVPIMYNYFAGLNANNVNAHARNCWLSVALRRYDRRTAHLKDIVHPPFSAFDPEGRWSDAMRDDYENTVMPDHFGCPFERGQGSGYDLFSKDAKFDYWEWRGRFESYHTWFHDGVMIRNTPVANGTQWPGGPGTDKKGIPQYSSFTFNRKDDPDLQKYTIQSEWLQSYLHRRWESTPKLGEVYKSASLSDIAVVYCAQGEHIQWPQSGGSSRIGRANLGSHMTARGGGTDVIFADGHVDWVVGTRIGLP